MSYENTPVTFQGGFNKMACNQNQEQMKEDCTLHPSSSEQLRFILTSQGLLLIFLTLFTLKIHWHLISTCGGIFFLPLYCPASLHTVQIVRKIGSLLSFYTISKTNEQIKTKTACSVLF